MGYDILDYEKILDVYGTMRDWHRLFDGLRVTLIRDLVVDHTSSEVRHLMLRKFMKDT